MKKLMLTIVMGLSIGLISCNKGTNPITNQQNNISSFNKLNKRYYHNYLGNAKLTKKQIATVDALAALSGASTGGSVAGLWGALCGAVAYGAYASAMAADQITLNPSPATDSNDHTISGVNIYTNVPGILHNSIIDVILRDTVVYGNDSNKNAQAIKNYCISIVSEKFQYSSVDLSNLIDSIINANQLSSYIQNPSTLFNNLGSENMKNICSGFYNTIFSLTSKSELNAYYLEFIQNVEQTNALCLREKQIALIFASITANSILYHEL
jgi:hypothetical protein